LGFILFQHNKIKTAVALTESSFCFRASDGDYKNESDGDYKNESDGDYKNESDGDYNDTE